MQRNCLNKPRISRPILRWFSRYAEFYVRRNFHSVRVAGATILNCLADYPVLVCANHPSWWDPLIALTLAKQTFPGRSHFAPIDAAALSKYRIFEKIGFFGIEPGTVRGAARFLRVGKAVLSDNSGGLWVTGQGTFVDPRVRPVILRSGVGHLVHSLPRVAVVPLAIEYPFWSERFPEALARWGQPIVVDHGLSRSPEEWTFTIAQRLSQTQDLLAEDAILRNEAAFEIILRGGAGVGGFYDVYRGFRAKLRGEHFHRAHGPKEI